MELLKLTTAVQGSMNSNHWVGSCSINNVVDQNTKVIGTENLYVIDVSCPLLALTPSLTIWPYRHQSYVCISHFVEVNSPFRSIDSINAHGQPSWCHYGHGRTSSGEGARCTRWPVSTHHVFQKDQHVSIPNSSLYPNTWQTSEVH